jgi:excisionase family DNA binding protein
MPDEVLSVAEVAERWNVNPMTIRRMINRGSLHAYSIDPEATRRVYRIPLTEVLRIEAARDAEQGIGRTDPRDRGHGWTTY